jgi:hypothetical protein
MISALAWIPAGVADPSPKRYELSSIEQELLEMMGEKGDPAEIEAKLMAKIAEKKIKSVSLPKAENTLPADLRMDDYSSDEDDEDAAGGDLVMSEQEGLGQEVAPEGEDGEDEDGEDEDGDEDDQDTDSNDAVSDDDDEGDELGDVPDTREFTPVNVEGLESMGLGGVHPEALGDVDPDDNEEDMDDVRLTPDDALVVVAKTEEVSRSRREP